MFPPSPHRSGTPSGRALWSPVALLAQLRGAQDCFSSSWLSPRKRRKQKTSDDEEEEGQATPKRPNQAEAKANTQDSARSPLSPTGGNIQRGAPQYSSYRSAMSKPINLKDSSDLKRNKSPTKSMRSPTKQTRSSKRRMSRSMDELNRELPETPFAIYPEKPSELRRSSRRKGGSCEELDKIRASPTNQFRNRDGSFKGSGTRHIPYPPRYQPKYTPSPLARR